MSTERPVSVTLENRLMSQGYYVERFERLAGRGQDDGTATEPDSAADETPVILEYETVSPLSVVTPDEVGTIIRTILQIADERETWQPPTIEATSLTTDGDIRGTWYVKTDWFSGLADELSEHDFSALVIDSIHNSCLDE